MAMNDAGSETGPFPVHDTVEKQWRHLDFPQHECLLHCRVPRVKTDDWRTLRVKPPWEGVNSGFTMLFEALILSIAGAMPVNAVAKIVDVDDEKIWRVVNKYVDKVVESQDMSLASKLGVDETSMGKGQNYVAVDLEEHRTLFVTEGRDGETLRKFAEEMVKRGGNLSGVTDFTCDMSAAFQLGIAKNFPEAEITSALIISHRDAAQVERLTFCEISRPRSIAELVLKVPGASRSGFAFHPERDAPATTRSRTPERDAPSTTVSRIFKATRLRGMMSAVTFDKFHLVKLLNETLDKVRRREAAKHPILKKSRWLFLHNEESLDQIRKWNLHTCRALQLRMAFQDIYHAEDRQTFERLFKKWLSWMRRCRVPEFRKVALTVEKHKDGILRWFDSRLSNSILEGINSLIQAAKARGFRTFKNFRSAIFLTTGRLDFSWLNPEYRPL